jgi:MFS superfamily sulfate permease-like transporter
VLATDLLIGVAIGMLAEFVVHVLRSVKWHEVLKLYFKVNETKPGVFHIRIDGAAFFANFLSLKSELATMPEGKTLIFDLSETETIDHTVMEFIHDFCEDYERRGGQCEMHGLDRHAASSDHPLAARRRVLAAGKP